MNIELPSKRNRIAGNSNIIGVRRSIKGDFIKIKLSGGRVLSIPLGTTIMSKTTAILRGLTNKDIERISPSNLAEISMEVDNYISDYLHNTLYKPLLYPSNLYLIGVSTDRKNNRVIRVAFARSRWFTIPLDALPNTRYVLDHFGDKKIHKTMLMGEMDDHAYNMGGELFQYICRFGTAHQKEKIKFFKPGGREVNCEQFHKELNRNIW
ncbi:MAG: hypothetical protein IT273_14690 [Chitinophagales bacterium]|nr:hypothetical protein [Chitinophagales bacterium]